MANRCCCGAISITTGAQIFAVLFVLSALGVTCGFSFTNGTVAVGGRIGGGTTISIIPLIAGILVFVACCRRSALFMIPMLIVSFLRVALATIALIGFFIVCIVALFSHEFLSKWLNENLHWEWLEGWGLAGISALALAIFALWFALEAWFFLVFSGCYDHLKTVVRRFPVIP